MGPGPAAALQVLATPYHLLGIKPLLWHFGMTLSPFGPCAGFYLQGEADAESRDLAENKNGPDVHEAREQEVPEGKQEDQEYLL